jgi:hypothetical protein
MRPLQDKTIDNVLRYLHGECLNGRHDGLQAVLALMRGACSPELQGSVPAVWLPQPPDDGISAHYARAS